MKRIGAVALVATALSACAVPGSLTDSPLTGTWGGEHIGLTLTPTGGTLEYDCASGTIDGPVMVHRQRFAATGSHSPATGGPERIGQSATSYPARYRGSVRGAHMTLTIVTADTELGPYTLEANRRPELLRCL